jgi:hypothetical protein
MNVLSLEGPSYSFTTRLKSGPGSGVELVEVELERP